MQRAKRVRRISAAHAMPAFLLDCRDLLVDSREGREVRRLVGEGLARVDGEYETDLGEVMSVSVTARGRDELGVLS